MNSLKFVVLGVFCYCILWIIAENSLLSLGPFLSMKLKGTGNKKPARHEIGSTSYFQDLCKRDDILSLPLDCNVQKNSTINESSLSSLLDCYSMQSLTNKTVNFFSVAHGDTYVRMLPLYAFFALFSNPNSVVEMVVVDREGFVLNHAEELLWLLNHFGSSSVCVRHVAPSTLNKTKTSNTFRFLEHPVITATYTYLADTDIFLTESVVDPLRLKQMEYWNIPYSNIIRPNQLRLTGVMLLRTDEFYTPKLLSIQQDMEAKGNDEVVLYKLVNSSGMGLPGTNYSDPMATYRPLHGVHLSTNRGPGKRMCLPSFAGGNRQDWCRLLSTPLLDKFLCISKENIILESISKIQIQLQYNMTLVGKNYCGQPQDQTKTTTSSVGVASTALYNTMSRNMFPIVPLGCAQGQHSSSILLHYLESTQDLFGIYRRNLTRKALTESGISPALVRQCELLLPLSYAQQALQGNVLLKQTSFGKLLNEYLSMDVVEIDIDKGDVLLQVFAACLAKCIPILPQLDELLSTLLLDLGMAFYIRKDNRLLLCGSTVRTRHSIQVVNDENDCASIKDNTPTFDQGLADSNFDMVMKHFFLHEQAISVLADKPTVLAASNKTLGIFVSGDGRVSNGGDLFGPLVAKQILAKRNQTDVKVVIGSDDTAPRVIAIVGSILQSTVRKVNLVTWGPGIIKDMKVSKLADASRVLAVRGPRTRDLLLAQHGLNPMVIGDPALIARDIMKNELASIDNRKKNQVCFVIHGIDRKYASEYCPFCMDRMVNNYNRNPRIILETLADCERVVSSSLHGCIFAHAMGIPALPIALGDRITGGDVKFVDYMHSVGVTAFQSRVNISQVWEESSANLTENDWKQMVDGMPQPKFPIPTSHYYETFPNIII